MSERPIRHRYPFWLAWPLELAALVIIGLTMWNYLQAALQTVFQQWPETLANVGAIPYAQQALMVITGPIPKGPVPWENLYEPLLYLNIRAFLLFFLAATIRSFLPRLRVQEKGLQVRRGLGWATIPWERITQVNSMSLPGDRLVLLIQGRRWRLGPWFRLYSLLWGGGLRKGIVVAWHISDFDALAQSLVAHLQEVYDEEELALIVDDTAYSTFYALLFLPRVTWGTLFAPRRVLEDAYSHSKWVHAAARAVAALLLILGLWRYVGVWWRFLAGRFEVLMNALRWPLIGTLLSTFGRPQTIIPAGATTAQADAAMSQAYAALLLGHVNIILTLVAVVIVLNLCPDWLLGAEGLAVYVRKKWLQIPWAAILSIRETLLANRGGVILLQVKRSCLTFWHAFYSLLYGAGLRRGVMFSSLLPGFEQLRERVHLGIVRCHEKDPVPPKKPILHEHGEAEFLLMTREPRATLRRWGERAAPEEGPVGTGGLLKRPLGATPSPWDLPWETAEEDRESRIEEGKREAERLDQARATRAALTLAAFPLVLVLLEELLFPALSRPLAFFALPVASKGSLAVVAAALLMGLLTLAEWPLGALLMSLIAEMYEQPGRFKRALSFYPRIQTPRVVPGIALLFLGATGMVQPLFLLWWFAGFFWGSILLWLAGQEFYGWRGLGNAFLLAGYGLFQGLTLLVYFLLR